MTKIRILNEGDQVLSVTEKFIAVRKENGEVIIFPMLLDSLNGYVNVEIANKVLITYGNNVVESSPLPGVEIYDF